MATWEEFGALAQQIGGDRLSDHTWMFTLPGDGEKRVQKTFVFHELIKPNIEVIKIASAFARLADVDPEKVLTDFGRLTVGAIGYTPLPDGGGFLGLATSIPLAALDLSSPAQFLVFVNLIARAADSIEQQLGGSGDAF